MLTEAQLKSLYRICYQLTYFMLQPIHIRCIDGGTGNLYILVGNSEEIEFEMKLNGKVI